jgi:hypothetical protein
MPALLAGPPGGTSSTSTPSMPIFRRACGGAMVMPAGRRGRAGRWSSRFGALAAPRLQTKLQAGRQAGRQAARQAARQPGRQAGRQPGRQAGRHL